jgi:tetratricopeptide (TPR) repeat protein
MLTCLLLDRGRDSEAVAAFEEWHRQDLADPFINFLLGLTRFLTGDEEGARLLFLAVSKERQWFAGLPDDTAISDKVKLYNDGEAILDDPKPYVACLEQLLDFCIPSLVFTFLDQTKTLPDEVLALPKVALVDAKASALQKDYAAAAERIERSLADNDGAGSFGAWWLAGECHFQLRAYDKALHALQQAIAADANPSDPAVFIRQGHVLLLKKRWPQARDAFLRSIRCKPTAESWSGVAHAEYRSEHLHTCYEALCEASLLDNERWDIWGQLVLLHLRNENSSLADQCFRQCLVQGPDSDELLLEIAGEYNKRKCGTTAAEAAVRFAMQIRDSGSARALMAEAIWNQNESEEAVLLAEEAIRLLQDQPEQRRAIFEKASGWCSALNKPALMGSLEAVNKKAGDTGSPISPLSLRSPRN